MSVEVPKEIGPYRIISKIGEGGMGEVYRAFDTRLERHVALKILLPEVARHRDRIQRFEKEAKAASALSHPNILTVYDVGIFEETRYIATELIDGQTLREKMQGPRLSLTEAISIAERIASALDAAHSAGILHRDIKPENIMIRHDGVVKVLDFGLAKLTENTNRSASPEDPTKAHFSTEPGLVVGTISYMSPEQARGQKLDARTDIFSLGIVMYELFSGKRPFNGEGQLDLISSILKDEPAPLRSYTAELPRQLERIVEKALRKDRQYRYQHVKDLEIDLEDLREEIKFEAKLNSTTDQAVPAQLTSNIGLRQTLTEGISTRRFTLLHLTGIIAAIALMIGAVVYFRPGMARSSSPAAPKSAEIANWISAPGELFSNASFSPDGKMIAFSSTRSGKKDIWITQTTSTEAIPVTKDEFSNVDPIWSPKGDEIAFYSQKGNNPGGGAGAGIWRVSALGGVPKSIAPISDGSFELRRWTESGKIYFQSNRTLHSVNVSTGLTEQTSSIDGEDGSVTWIDISPDEQSISYITEKEGNWKLFFKYLKEGSTPREVASGIGSLGGIVWLAQKNRYYYSALVDGVYQIYSVSVQGSPSRITTSETDSVVVDAAADGKSLIVSSVKEESDVWRVGRTDGQESPVARTVAAELWPTVSPDDSAIAYQSTKNLNRGNNLLETSIVVRTVGSRDERQTQLSDRGFLPAWAPDGSLIAFLRRNERKALELWIANPNGGSARSIASGGIPLPGYSVSPYNYIHTAAFAWSPDSSRIAHISDKGGSPNIWIAGRDASESQLTSYTEVDRTVLCPVWSSDGKRLAYFFQKKPSAEGKKPVRGLSVFNTETGQQADVYQSEATFRFIGWTSDENGLIIAETEKSGGLPPETLVKRVSISDGSSAEIVRIKNAYYYNIFLSKDRRNIAFAARNNDLDDLWVVPSAGGVPRKLTANNDSGLSMSRLSWSNGGSAIFFGKQTRFSMLSLVTNIE